MNAFSTTVRAEKLRKVIPVPRSMGKKDVFVTVVPVARSFNPAQFRGFIKSSRKKIDRDIKTMREDWDKRERKLSA